MSFSTPNC